LPPSARAHLGATLLLPEPARLVLPGLLVLPAARDGGPEPRAGHGGPGRRGGLGPRRRFRGGSGAGEDLREAPPHRRKAPQGEAHPAAGRRPRMVTTPHPHQPAGTAGREQTMTIEIETLRRLPKAELHVHLDGSLRPATLLELAAERGRPLPRADEASLRDYMHVTDARNLVDYLARFDVTLSVMQDAPALERVAYELALDLADESVRYAEIRYSPMLHTGEGLPLTEAVEAPLRGLRRAEQERGIRTALIICGIRNMDPATSRDLADLTVAYKGRGVVAFDLAGAEYNYPAKKHKDAFYTVINRNM